MHVGGIFCHLAKAFYCVNHDILLAMLHCCCIQGVNADWLRFYLKNREQEYEITSSIATQNFLSDLGALKHGVSQGSILGLLLFVLYVNDLPLRINSSLKPTIIADDTSVIIFSKYFDNSCRVLNLLLYCKWFATKKCRVFMLLVMKSVSACCMLSEYSQELFNL
jgi:Reverse transcriptase (RNA-dependent DNA polymerase).